MQRKKLKEARYVVFHQKQKSMKMIIKLLQNSDAEKLEQFLSYHAETSMFLRSNMKRSGLEYKNEDYHGEYLGAFDETGNITGVLAHYQNGNIMMQAEDKAILSKLVAAFRNMATRPVAGVLGADDQAKLVIDELLTHVEQYATNRAEGLYNLDLNHISSAAGSRYSGAQMLEMAKVDEALLTRWMRAYEIEALGSEGNKALDQHVKNHIDQKIKSKSGWVLLVEGNPVALSGFNAQLPDMVQIGPVWTPPEHRNRGYARTLVALTLQKARDQGVKKAILFSDNPAAIKAYEAIGFKKIGSYRLALLKKPLSLST